MPHGEVCGERSNGDVLQWTAVWKTQNGKKKKKISNHTTQQQSIFNDCKVSQAFYGSLVLLFANLNIFFEQTLKIMEIQTSVNNAGSKMWPQIITVPSSQWTLLKDLLY